MGNRVYSGVIVQAIVAPNEHVITTLDSLASDFWKREIERHAYSHVSTFLDIQIPIGKKPNHSRHLACTFLCINIFILIFSIIKSMLTLSKHSDKAI